MMWVSNEKTLFLPEVTPKVTLLSRGGSNRVIPLAYLPGYRQGDVAPGRQMSPHLRLTMPQLRTQLAG